MFRLPAFLRLLRFSRKSRRSAGVAPGSESLEIYAVLSADPLPVLMVIADQQDFYYKEYADTRASLEAAGVEVVVAATITNISTPHWNSDQPLCDPGEVTSDLALSEVNPADYSAIALVGGWKSSMYQYTSSTGDYVNNLYDGDLATKNFVNNLINVFEASGKYLGFICHTTTIGAWSRVNGNRLFAGKQVSVPYTRSPAVQYNRP